MFLFRLIFKAPFAAYRAGRGTARLVGYRRVALVACGVGVGLLVAPTSGAELRRRIREAIARRRAGSEPSVEERVRLHLQQSPRTWHLPQPEVVAVPIEDGPGWEVILAGEATNAATCRDLESAAAAVTGVVRVDNRLRIASAATNVTTAPATD